jgi:hypothetical protein
MTGASVSLTVTVNEHCAELRRPSTAVHVTVVTPDGKTLPEGGVAVTLTVEDAVLEAVTSNVTTVPGGPVHSAVMGAGQLMVIGLMTWASARQEHIELAMPKRTANACDLIGTGADFSLSMTRLRHAGRSGNRTLVAKKGDFSSIGSSCSLA